MINEELFKECLISVCNTVNRFYEKFDLENRYWSSVTRTPAGDIERCETMEQFVECRINFECFFIPELKKYSEMMDGHLFDVVSLEGIDEKKRKFKTCMIALHELSDTWISDQDFWTIHEEICKLLGPERRIFFSWAKSKSRIKLQLL